MKRSLALVLSLTAALAGCKKDATAKEAKEMLSAFVAPGADHAKLYAELRPKPEDYEAVFVGDAAQKAKAVMEPLWESGKGLDPTSEQTQVDVAGATPEQLAKHEGTALGCPAGYKDIASKLQSTIIVYCFRFVKPGERGGLAGDALVHVNGHWAYFPKPFRYLNPSAPAASAGPSSSPAPSGTPGAGPAPGASGAPGAGPAPGANPGDLQ